MDILGPHVGLSRYNSAGDISLKPIFRSSNYPGDVLKCFPPNTASCAVDEDPGFLKKQMYSKYLIPVNDDKRAHVLVSSPEGLHLLKNYTDNSGEPSASLWWKKIATTEDHLFKSTSELLTIISYLEQFGVATPYSPISAQIRSELEVISPCKPATLEIGVQVGENGASLKNGHTLQDSSMQTDVRESAESTKGTQTDPLPLFDNNITISVTFQNGEIGDDVVFLSLDTTKLKEDKNLREQNCVQGQDARVIKEIIFKVLGLDSQIYTKRLYEAEATYSTLLNEGNQKNNALRFCGMERSIPEGKSDENLEMASHNNRQEHQCHSDEVKHEDISTLELFGTKHSKSLPVCDVETFVSSNTFSNECQTESEIAPDQYTETNKSMVPQIALCDPRAHRILSANVYKSPETNLTEHFEISPFMTAGYRNENEVPRSLVGIDIPFLGLDDVEPMFDDEQKYVSVGRGAYGFVYLGTYVNKNQIVAIKTFHRKQSLTRTMEEVRLLLQVRDTGFIPDCYGIWNLPTDPLNLSIVMEYFGDGKTLRCWIDEKPQYLSDNVWIQICRQLFAGIRKIHQKHVLINDIKSDNILLQISQNGSPYLKYIDFGLASFRMGIRYKYHNLPKQVYKFLAPEICEGGCTTVASDIYSLGYILEEICYGIGLSCIKDVAYAAMRTYPFDRPSPEDILVMLEKIFCDQKTPTTVRMMLDRNIEAKCVDHFRTPISGNVHQSGKRNINETLIWWSARSVATTNRTTLHNVSIDCALPFIRTLANAGAVRNEFIKEQPIQFGTSPFRVCEYEDDGNVPNSLSNISFPMVDVIDVSFVRKDHSRVTLGKGSFGCVYLAEMKGRKEYVAVKDFDLDQSSKSDIEQEAKMLQYLQDTCYVPEFIGCMIGDLGSDDLNILQECIGGGCTFQHVLHHPPDHFTRAIWLDIAAEMALGLKLIHEKHVLINDIKADNILIDPAITSDYVIVKYIDFGLATFRSSYRFQNDPDYLEPFLYLAPEVRGGYYTTPVSDIYSFGYILELIAKKSDLDELSEIASMCLRYSPAERPLIKTVYHLICGLLQQCELEIPG